MPSFPLPAALTNAVNTAKTAAASGSLPIPVDTVKAFLQGQPAYVVNRERAATVLDAGFRTSDTYARFKPALFIGGLAGMALSAFTLYKRRGRGAETWTVWATVFAASAATAWVTRPTPTVKAPAGSSAQTKSTFGVLGVIDARRAKLKAQDPNFADKVFARFDALPVVKEQLDQTPLLKAVL